MRSPAVSMRFRISPVAPFATASGFTIASVLSLAMLPPIFRGAEPSGSGSLRAGLERLERRLDEVGEERAIPLGERVERDPHAGRAEPVGLRPHPRHRALELHRASGAVL